MINKKIALSAISILSALVLMGAATFAFFSNQGSSTGNIFAAGTLDLQLDDENEQFIDDVSASITGSDMAPGDSTSGFISLHNNGSLSISDVVLGATQTNNTNGGDGSDLADVLNLTVKTNPDDNTCPDEDGDTADLTGTIASAIGNSSLPLTLTELVNEDYDALPGLTPGSSYFLCVTATLDSDAGNEYQGDSKTVNFDFTANQ